MIWLVSQSWNKNFACGCRSFVGFDVLAWCHYSRHATARLVYRIIFIDALQVQTSHPSNWIGNLFTDNAIETDLSLCIPWMWANLEQLLFFLLNYSALERRVDLVVAMSSQVWLQWWEWCRQGDESAMEYHQATGLHSMCKFSSNVQVLQHMYVCIYSYIYIYKDPDRGESHWQELHATVCSALVES